MKDLSLAHLQSHASVTKMDREMPAGPDERNSNGEPGCTPDDHGLDAVASKPVDVADLERASRLFRALGDPARLRLAERLIRREFCVTELAECERESISTISQRLRVLRGENIVARRRRGKHINYALVDQHVADLITNAVLHASEPAARKPSTEQADERGNDE
jgi:DNA-binding transcriptional ArsR family regulator